MLSTGRKLGDHYEIIAPLGEGGMSEVYRAKDLRLDREVAIKILTRKLSSDPISRERFEREAKAIAGLNHPNILTIYDFGDEGEIAFAVTELLHGKTFRELLHEKGKLDTEELLRIALQAARGLAAAHAQHIVHRDIKPENLFLTESGEVKVLDFGLARSEPDTTTLTLGSEQKGGTLPLMTTPGTILGTIGYMSPEQAKGETATTKSDVFSLGCVLYEMATGKRPFERASAAEAIAAVIKDSPAPLEEMAGEASPGSGLVRLIEKTLAKEPDERYSTAGELEIELRDLLDEATQGKRRAGFGVGVGVAIAAGVAVAIGAVFFLPYRAKQDRMREAREVITPRVMELAEAKDYIGAFDAAQEALAVIPDDPVLNELAREVTNDISIHSVPAGASVAYKPYGDVGGPWRELGATPIDDVRLPIGAMRWKLEKEGYERREFGRHVANSGMDEALASDSFERASDEGDLWSFKLHRSEEVPEGMISLPGGRYRTPLTSFAMLEMQTLGEAFIDKTEVTNVAYRDFVEAGGYSRRELWKQPFTKEGEEIPFEAAVKSFVDSTGRPGPATWVAGSFADGEGDYPVGGVSWFEAAAYAEFAGKSLPTVFHWTHAAMPSFEIALPLSPVIVPLSNFSTEGPMPVGSNAGVSAGGALDMAGNVREWCWNADGELRYTLGGSWEGPLYMFGHADAASPWQREATQGFRCIKYLNEDGPGEQIAAPIVRSVLDYRTLEGAPDALVDFLVSQSQYDPAPFNTKIDSREDSGPYRIHEVVTIDATYGNERIIVHIDLPKHARPPFQPIVYLSGINCILMTEFREVPDEDLEYIVKSGRALVRPVLQGMYERNDGTTAAKLFSERDAPALLTAWTKDLRRTLDYLETRNDIDSENMGYTGMSLGATIAPTLIAMEERFDAAVLISGGFSSARSAAGVSVAFAKRMKIPTLMLNGRYDYTFPLETHQIPLLEKLGAAPENKKHVLYETGHVPLPQLEVIRESLDWYDKYLGPATSSGE